MRLIHESAVAHIAMGAAVLGTGGGGDPLVGRLAAEAAIRERGPVRLIDVDEVPGDAWVVPSFRIGAPTVGIEKLFSWRELDDSFDDMEAALKARAHATMAIEIGGKNALLPIVIAARRGIALVNADAMGRAFPGSQMVSFCVHGIPARLATLADEKGNRIVMYPSSGAWQETLARPVVERMGASAMMCAFPVTGEELRRSAIAGSVERAERIGRALMEPSVHGGEPMKALTAETGARRIIRGKLVELDRRTVGGFARGSATFEGIDADQGRRVVILFQNEYLLALEAGSPRAMTPDLIAILDRETARPLMTEGLRYGARADVIAFACDPVWRTPAGLGIVGPRNFDYDTDYIPVEMLLPKHS